MKPFLIKNTSNKKNCPNDVIINANDHLQAIMFQLKDGQYQIHVETDHNRWKEYHDDEQVARRRIGEILVAFGAAWDKLECINKLTFTDRSEND